jgi:hypothetical protein
MGAPILATAQEATPAASAAAAGPPEILVEAIIPAESIPAATERLFFLGLVTIEPEGHAVSPTEVYSCCPGPQFEHVLEGELSLRVEGPLQIVHAGGDGTPGPTEEVVPGTEVVLQPGDTAIYQTQLTTEYNNRGAEPVRFVQSGLFPEPPPDAPAGSSVGMTTDALEFEYPVLSPPPGPLVATLQRATLPPDGLFPAPPSEALQLVVAAPGSPSLAKTSDGAVRNTGQEPALVYALTLQPADGGAATPIP